MLFERGVPFEAAVVAINDGKILDSLIYLGWQKYSGQKIFIIEINRYAFAVPYVEDQ